MENIIRVAIDGPSGAGKSTIAKAIAKKMNYDYIDTGAMYRAIGYKMEKIGVASTDLEKLQAALDTTEIDFTQGNIILDGKNINNEIRTSEVAKAASKYSAVPIVREKLVELQRTMGHKKSVIMDGRDIGTNVLTDAQFKFFITATAEERANRRFKELVEKGQEVDYNKILEDIIQRDHNDMTRELNPLKKADDALEVDTTNMSIDQVIEFICEEMK